MAGDLPEIVSIYNASIPGRLATADTEPLTVAQRQDWFAAFDAGSRPLWVAESAGRVVGWLGFRSFYGRPAYHRTVEVSLYVALEAQRQGVGRFLLRHGIAAAPTLGIRTLLGFVFGHNAPSLSLFRQEGFVDWGLLPQVAELDGVERDLLILGRRS